MARDSSAIGDVLPNKPTEQSPLLNGSGDSNRHGSIGAHNPFPAKKPPGDSTGSVTVLERSAEDEENLGEGNVVDERTDRSYVARIVAVLLIGIFVAHADGTILLATHPIIASEFNDLANSTWLITGFTLAGAATQAMYGKLSDIYGRRMLVITAYLIFVLGCTIVAAGQTMWQVVLGRVISGAGASGMTGLVSILITDLLPIRDVAQWRAYVNLVATFGRSIGGPLGGWLVDVIGWRWSFLGQVPLVMLATLLAAIYLPGSSSPDLVGSSSSIDNGLPSQKARLRRIDFEGSIIFALMVLALLLPIELGGDKLPWTHPAIFVLLGLSGTLIFVFVAVERRQEEPVLPLEIFQSRDAVFSFLILGLQTAAQLGLMFSVPLYFSVTARASSTASGAHLVPAVIGNAFGGLISGVIIKRSGRYKTLIVLAVALSALGYLLLMFRWHGNTNIWESLYIFPTGFGTGVVYSAVFISLQAVIDPAHMAPAVSFMYLSSTVALTIGLPLSNVVLHTVLRKGLGRRLPALGLGLQDEEVQRIIQSTLSDVDFVDRVTGKVRDAIVASYIDGFWWSHGVSFLFSTAAFALAIFIRQRRLGGPGE